MRNDAVDYIQAQRKSKPSPRVISVLGALVVALLSGCAGPRLESVGGPGASDVVLAADGVQLTIRPAAWSAFPGDLSRSVTPIGIRIENTRPDEVEVRLDDFALLDDARNQYRALPAPEVARTVGIPAPDPAFAAGPWPWHPWGRPFWGYPSWGPAWYGDPYGAYWYAWRASQDILRLALREGRILPGASVDGFVYFQLATGYGSSLTFSWTPRTGGGAPLTPLTAQLRIVR